MTPQSKAYKAGYERGVAAGSWILDGNSSANEAARIIKGYEDGDPEIMDMAPSPLSGEWAGESIPELSDRYDLDLDDDDVATDFEDGFSDGFWEEVLRSARAMVA